MRVIFWANDFNIVFNTIIWKVKMCQRNQLQTEKNRFLDLQMEFITVKSIISIRGIT